MTVSVCMIIVWDKFSIEYSSGVCRLHCCQGDMKWLLRVFQFIWTEFDREALEFESQDSYELQYSLEAYNSHA